MNQATKSYITIFIEGMPPQSYDLDFFNSDCIRMGRGPCHGDQNGEKNNIMLPPDFPTVSRAHCSFYRVEGAW